MALVATNAVAQDGLPDPAFGYLGRSYLYWNEQAAGDPPENFAHAAAVQRDGRIVLAGPINDYDFFCGGSTTSIGISRLLADGSFDASFGDAATPGQTVIHAGCQHGFAGNAVAIQDDGRIVVAGSDFFLGLQYASAWRLLANGAVDAGFGGSGQARLVRATGLAPDDRAWSLVVGTGEDRNGIPRDWLAIAGGVRDGAGDGVRRGAVFVLDGEGDYRPGGNYSDPDGTQYFRLGVFSAGAPLDNEFYAFGGCTANEIPRCYAVGYAMGGSPLRPIGTLEVMRWPDFAGEFFVSWSFDPATVNAAASVPTSVAYDRLRRRVWVGGTVRPLGASDDRMGVAAFLPSGPLDTSVLGGNGRAMFDFSVPPAYTGHAQSNGIVVQRDGRIVLGGWFYWNDLADDARFAALRLHDDGSPDGSFGDFSSALPGVQAGQVAIAGAAAETRATSLAFVAGEKLLLGGYTHDYNVAGAWYFAAVQLTGDLIFADGCDD